MRDHLGREVAGSADTKCKHFSSTKKKNVIRLLILISEREQAIICTFMCVVDGNCDFSRTQTKSRSLTIERALRLLSFVGRRYASISSNGYFQPRSEVKWFYFLRKSFPLVGRKGAKSENQIRAEGIFFFSLRCWSSGLGYDDLDRGSLVRSLMLFVAVSQVA